MTVSLSATVCREELYRSRTVPPEEYNIAFARSLQGYKPRLAGSRHL